MSGFTSLFGAQTIQPSDFVYTHLELDTNVTLGWAFEGQPDVTLVARIMDLEASVPGIELTLPPADEAGLGISIIMTNIGAETITVLDNDGNTVLSLAAAESWMIYLTNNEDAAGAWRTFQMASFTSQAQAANLAGAGLKAIGSTLNWNLPITNFSSTGQTMGSGDRGTIRNWTGGVGTVNIAAASTLGTGWTVGLRNSGSGVLTVDPDSSETIDGAATIGLQPGDACFIDTDGVSSFYTIGRGQSAEIAFDYTTIDVAGAAGDYTLAGAELNRIAYQFTGVLTGNRNIIVPGTIQQYWVANDTTGAFTLTVKTAAGTGVTVTQGSRAILYSDGTDVLLADTGGIATPIAIASGGTGATTASGARTNLGATATGNSLFTAASAAAARSTLGSTTVGDAVFIAASAAAARSALGSTAVGDALFITATAAAARTTLGATATGSSLFTAADAAAARTAIGATATGSSLITAANATAARSTLGATATGDALFTAATAAAARSTLGVSPSPTTYDSGELTITNSATILSAAHGLGAIPTNALVWLRCKSAELGYSINDEFPIPVSSVTSSTGLGMRLTATSVVLVSGSNIRILNLSTHVDAAITNASWRLIVRLRLQT